MSEELGILGRKHIMIDIETLSSRQNAIIIQIGACSFTFEDGIGESFLHNVDIESCLNAGMHFAKDTYEWWMTQDETVFKSCLNDAKPISEVLHYLNTFIGKDKKTLVWAQGSVFDLGILSSAYTLCGINKSWKYFQEMDSRTVFTLLNVRNDLERKGAVGHHNALNDAIAQAETLIKVFKEN